MQTASLTNKQNVHGESLLSVTREPDPGNEQQVEEEENHARALPPDLKRESGLAFLFSQG